jgi:hypothetical protein
LKIRYAVRQGLSRQIDAALGMKMPTLDEPAEWPILGRLMDRKPEAYSSASVTSLMDLDKQYQTARDKLKSQKEKGVYDPQLEAQIFELEAAHNDVILLERMWGHAKDANARNDPNRYHQLKRMMTGMARESLGLETEQYYRSPMRNPNILPRDVRKDFESFIDTRIKTAYKDAGKPIRQKRENSSEYRDRLRSWKLRKSAYILWIKKYSDTPLMRRRKNQVLRPGQTVP